MTIINETSARKNYGSDVTFDDVIKIYNSGRVACSNFMKKVRKEADKHSAVADLLTYDVLDAYTSAYALSLAPAPSISDLAKTIGKLRAVAEIIDVQLSCRRDFLSPEIVRAGLLIRVHCKRLIDALISHYELPIGR